jgi:hypothetical protein
LFAEGSKFRAAGIVVTMQNPVVEHALERSGNVRPAAVDVRPH